MSAESFAFALGALIERALAKGLNVNEIHDTLAVAGMVLDDRYPQQTFEDEEVTY